MSHIGGTTEIRSPDGRWRATVRPDTRLVGYDSEDVTALIVVDTATGTKVVDQLLRQADLLLVRFLAPRRILFVTLDGSLYYEKDLETSRERRLKDPNDAIDSFDPDLPNAEGICLEYSTGRAGLVGLVFFLVAGAIALLGSIQGLLTARADGLLGLSMGLGFIALALVARTYRGEQTFDPSTRLITEVRRSVIHQRVRVHAFGDFERVQLCCAINRGAPLFYLALEGRHRMVLLPTNRDWTPLMPVGEQVARVLGVAWVEVPIDDWKR